MGGSFPLFTSRESPPSPSPSDVASTTPRAQLILISSLCFNFSLAQHNPVFIILAEKNPMAYTHWSNVEKQILGKDKLCQPFPKCFPKCLHALKWGNLTLAKLPQHPCRRKSFRQLEAPPGVSCDLCV